MSLSNERGSLLIAMLAATLLTCCIALARSPSHYGVYATFDGTLFELRVALPALCVRVRAVLLDELARLSSVSLCGNCQRESWS